MERSQQAERESPGGMDGLGGIPSHQNTFLPFSSSIAQAALAEVRLPLELFLSHILQRIVMPEKRALGGQDQGLMQLRLTVGLQGRISLYGASP